MLIFREFAGTLGVPAERSNEGPAEATFIGKHGWL